MSDTGGCGDVVASAALQWLFANTADAVLYTANDGATCVVNPAMCTLDGRSAEEICAHDGPEFADVADRSNWLAATRGGRSADGSAAGRFVAEPKLLRHDGSKFAAAISSAWSLGDSGRRQVITIIRDVSSRPGTGLTSSKVESDALESDALQEFRRCTAEVNDDIVQALVAAETAFDLDNIDQARELLAAASRIARAGLDVQLGGGELHAGSLLRSRPALLDSGPAAAATRVLIVDDSPDVRGLISAILSGQQGFWVVVGEAGDGKQAIEIARLAQPDLVLLDLSMPVMDGLEALSEIRRVAPLATVVVLSGIPENKVRETVLELGAHGYIEKAELVDTLIPKLTMLLAARPGIGSSPAELNRPI